MRRTTAAEVSKMVDGTIFFTMEEEGRVCACVKMHQDNKPEYPYCLAGFPVSDDPQDESRYRQWSSDCTLIV